MDISVAIVEDVDDVRHGLAFLIDSAAGFRCAGAYGDAETAIAVIGRTGATPPDVVLMDIGLPGMSGIEAVRQLRAVHAQLPIMMLTVYEDDGRIFDSLRAGAAGYVLKQTPPPRLLESIGILHHGGSAMSSQIARRVVESFQEPATSTAGDLTAREREILELLVRGFRYREIGERLFISLDTVRTHIRHIYEKMHVRSRAEATAKFLGREDAVGTASPAAPRGEAPGARR